MNSTLEPGRLLLSIFDGSPWRWLTSHLPWVVVEACLAVTVSLVRPMIIAANDVHETAIEHHCIFLESFGILTYFWKLLDIFGIYWRFVGDPSSGFHQLSSVIFSELL